jgi:thiol-disulfide isomerase/thioredoxin
MIRAVRSSLLAFALLPAMATAQVIARGGTSELLPGSSAPEIDLETLEGGRVRLSRLRGHPVVVTFWGTWCPPCKEEFPELVAAHRRYREAGLEVLAVNQRDQELRTSDVAAFVKEYGVEFIVALDPRGKSRRSYRLIALPTTVFIDSAGIIQQVNSGPITPVQVAAGLTRILARK